MVDATVAAVCWLVLLHQYCIVCSAKGLVHLADALKINKYLRSLSLGAVLTSAAAMATLASALEGNVTLYSLDVSQSTVGSSGMRSLAAALAVNSTLRVLKCASSISCAADAAEVSACGCLAARL